MRTARQSDNGAAKLGWTSFGDYLRRGYRPDIDGLRAIAVLSVIAYHFQIGPVPGGFTGVDVFFVISGFLITSTIVDKLDVDAFSFLDFYQRRIRRIFPALAVVLAFVLVLGLTFLREEELFRVSASPFGLIYYSVAAGAAFITNFTLLHKADYFAQTAASQPLLHLWSLAIEEQFYIVWPLLLFGIRAVRAKCLPFVLAIAAASFALNILSVHTDPSAAFYSPLSRAWELMLGAALACLPVERLRTVAVVGADARSAVGLALIVLGLFAIKNSMAFPGWAALLPTLGTVLVISAGPDALPNRSVLGARGLVWIGLISYPLYLWHWPALLFFQKYAADFAVGPFERPSFKAAILLCSVVASWLTFRFVEVPFRFGAWRDPLHTGGLAFSMMAVGLAGLIAPAVVSTASLSPYQRETMPLLRQVTELEDLDKLYGDRPCFRYRRSDTAALFLQNQCVEPKYAGAKTVFLVGDSHSASLGLGLRPLLERSRANLLQVSTGWCEPIADDYNDTTCKDISELVLKKIAELKPDVVMLDAFWVGASQPPFFSGGDSFFSHFAEQLKQPLQNGAKRIIVVGEIPVWYPSLPETLARKFVRDDKAIPQRTFLGVNLQSLDIDTAMRAITYPLGVTYLSMKDVLCNDAGCLTRVGPDLERDIIVWDYGHLTPAGSTFIARTLVEPALADILAQE